MAKKKKIISCICCILSVTTVSMPLYADTLSDAQNELQQYEDDYQTELENQAALEEEITEIQAQLDAIDEQTGDARSDLTDMRNDLQDDIENTLPRSTMDVRVWSRSIEQIATTLRNQIEQTEKNIDALTEQRNMIQKDLDELTEQLEIEQEVLRDYEYLTESTEDTITAILEQEEEKEHQQAEANLAAQSAADNTNRETAITSGESVGTYKGYTLTEDELRGITVLCEREQGSSAAGVAAEASLIANRYQAFGQKYTSLYQYVINCGWWGKKVASHMTGNPSKSSNIEVVRDVICNGNRTLPSNIDEHDCLSDITSVSNNGTAFNKSDRDSYISGVTKIKNRYGATYTFYCFSHKNGDPFGSTGKIG